MEERVAIVAGAHRPDAVSLEVCRTVARASMKVLLLGIDREEVEACAAALVSEGLDVRGHCVDVCSEASVVQFVRSLLSTRPSTCSSTTRLH